MAIVFWNPLGKQDLQQIARDIFSDVKEQDSLVEKYKLEPFFSKKLDPAEKILLITDVPSFFHCTPQWLSDIQAIGHQFSQFFPPESIMHYFSLRDPKAFGAIKAFFPQSHTTMDTNFQEMKAPAPGQWKPTLFSSFSMGTGLPSRQEPILSPSPINSSALKIYWPSCFHEASKIISINPFASSSVFTIQGAFSSLFYALPSSAQTMILVQSSEQKRAHLFSMYLHPLIKKLSHSFLFSPDNNGFLLLSNDFLAGDVFASALCGIKALKVPLSRWIHQKKWGMGDIIKINLIGPGFQKPLKYFVAEISAKHWESLHWLSHTCSHCMQCITACPLNAWRNERKIHIWEPKKCNRCGHCIDLCPTSSIQRIIK